MSNAHVLGPTPVEIEAQLIGLRSEAGQVQKVQTNHGTGFGYSVNLMVGAVNTGGLAAADSVEGCRVPARLPFNEKEP